ncbi:MAG TPA: homoserine kinase [Selenomonadales bacterium]|nr:homoserine kinase [Selenomonadales bacterium]
MSNVVKVRVPGTTANCGSGFDTLGIACTIYNEFTLSLTGQDDLTVEVTGEGRDIIPADERNIAVKAVRAVLDRVGWPGRGMHIAMTNAIPLARGLGSSAAAIVAGLVAANAATGNTLSPKDILAMATAFEGHPDNVAPALTGGVTVSFLQDGQPHSLRFVPPSALSLVVAVPAFTLATELARQALPQTVPFSDAVFNVSRAALLSVALCQGEFGLLRYALEDRLHQPYREKLVPGMPEVFAAAMNNGALGVALSGAGPCLMAFADRNEAAIGEAMVQAFKDIGVTAAYLSLNIDTEGTKVLSTA